MFDAHLPLFWFEINSSFSWFFAFELSHFFIIGFMAGHWFLCVDMYHGYIFRIIYVNRCSSSKRILERKISMNISYYLWFYHFENYRNMNPRPKKVNITARLVVKDHPLLQMKILVAGILTHMELVLNEFERIVKVYKWV